ncbi:MAG: tape measure protein [Gemmataceae bacterium]
MATEIAGAAIKFTGNASPLQAVVKDVARSLYALDAAISKTGQADAAKGFATAIADTRKELAAANKEAGLLSRSLGAVGKAAVTGVGFGLGLAGIRGLSDITHRVANLGAESVSAAADAQRLAAGYEALAGSADKAAGLIAELRKFAAASPLGSQPILETGQQLLASGIPAGQVVPTTKALGQLAVGDGEKLKRLALAYSQVAAAGQLYGTELRQFTEAGVPLLDALATAMNKPKEMMKSLGEEGKIGFKDVVSAIKSLTSEGGKFANLTEKYSQTFPGQMERMKDSADSLKRALGEELIRELRLGDLATRAEAALARTRSGVDDLKPALRAAGEGFSLLADLAEKAGERIGRAFRSSAVTNMAQTVETGLRQFRGELAGPPPPPPPSTGDILFGRLAVLDRVGRDAMNGAFTLNRPLDEAERLRTPLENAKFAGTLAVLRQMVRFVDEDLAAGRRPLMPVTREHFALGAAEPYSLSAAGGAVAPHGLALGAYPVTGPTPEYRPGRPLALDVLAERRMIEALRPTAPPPAVYSPNTPPAPVPPRRSGRRRISVAWSAGSGPRRRRRTG